MTENANESWWKPTNILLCLLLFASSVQKAAPMNSEKFHPSTPSEKKKKVARPLAANIAHALTPG